MNAGIVIVEADWDNADHGRAAVELLNEYAKDPNITGKELPEQVRDCVVSGLREHATSLVYLAYCGEEPVGIAVCFVGYSTFAARPSINVHDLGVRASCRGQGVGGKLLTRVEEKARELGCCKLTLEVHNDNDGARRLYNRLGFEADGRPQSFLVKRL